VIKISYCQKQADGNECVKERSKKDQMSLNFNEQQQFWSTVTAGAASFTQQQMRPSTSGMFAYEY